MLDLNKQPWQPAGAGLAALPAYCLQADFLRYALARAPTSWQVDPLDDLSDGHSTLGHTRAAVLIPLVMRADALHVLLTRRAEHLSAHAGQICFPGGRLENHDASPAAGALRETREEIGLASDYIDILGDLPVYLTNSGFLVTPTVALIRTGFTLSLDHNEVTDVFEVPLAFLMDPINHRLSQRRLPDGRHRPVYAMPWQHHVIWGATAAMLRNLYHCLHAAWQVKSRPYEHPPRSCAAAHVCHYFSP